MQARLPRVCTKRPSAASTAPRTRHGKHGVVGTLFSPRVGQTPAPPTRHSCSSGPDAPTAAASSLVARVAHCRAAATLQLVPLPRLSTERTMLCHVVHACQTTHSKKNGASFGAAPLLPVVGVLHVCGLETNHTGTLGL